MSDVSKHPRIQETIKVLAKSTDPANNTEFVAAIEGICIPILYKLLLVVLLLLQHFKTIILNGTGVGDGWWLGVQELLVIC